MAATTFPRFLELPKELQIQIWEHAVTGITGQFASKHSPRQYRDFGKKLDVTVLLLLRDGVKARLHVGGRVTSLVLPPFYSVLAVSRMARFVACEWWRRLLVESGTATAQGLFFEEQKVEMVADLDEIILDLTSKLNGQQTVASAL